MTAVAKPKRRKRKLTPIEVDGVKVKVTPLVRRATALLVSGRARNVTEAAEMCGCDRAHLSRTLNEPHNKIYLGLAAKQEIFAAAPIAARALVGLIDSDNSKVSLDAAKHVLSMQGISPPDRPSTNLSVHVSPGYVIDLRDPADRRDAEHDQRRAPARIDRDSAEDIDGECEPEPAPESIQSIIDRLG